MYALFLKICAPCIWIFFLCRLIPTFYEMIKYFNCKNKRFSVLIYSSCAAGEGWMSEVLNRYMREYEKAIALIRELRLPELEMKGLDRTGIWQSLS